jgi:hypothetical protein
MTTASNRFTREGDRKVLNASQVGVFAAALIFWAAYFYAMDQSIMESQGLPVAWTLMPK